MLPHCWSILGTDERRAWCVNPGLGWPVRRSLDVLAEGRLLQLSGLSFHGCFDPAKPVFSDYRHEISG